MSEPSAKRPGSALAAIGALMGVASLCVWMIVRLPTPAIGLAAVGLGLFSVWVSWRARAARPPVAVWSVALGVLNLVLCVWALAGFDFVIFRPTESPSTFRYSMT